MEHEQPAMEGEVRLPSKKLPRLIWLSVIVGCLFLLLRGCREVQNSALLASCRPTTIWYMAESIAGDDKGLCPALSEQPGRLTMSWEDMQRSGWGNAYDRVCEAERRHRRYGYDEVPERELERWYSDDWSYVYLGYVIENDVQARAFLDAYPKLAGRPGAFEGDLPVAAGQGTCGSDVISRLYALEGLPERLECLKSRANSIPVVIEWPDNHLHPGGKVVWLDGSTEFVAYPGKFPMTKLFIEGLRRLDTRTP